MSDAAPSREPNAAELARSVLATANSLTLTTEGHRVELIGLHAVEASAHLVLPVPVESHLGDEIAAAPQGALAATVEFTDVAPVAVPDRVRARLLLGGRLRVAEDYPATAVTALRFEPETVTLERAGRPADVDPDDLARAEPDPLAATEAEMLTHLAGAHGEAIELLTQLVEPRDLIGVTRVAPLRLDRYGVVLRLQRACGHRDVRLVFPETLSSPVQAVVQVQTLLAHARTCRRRRRRSRT
jgi:hypothetical protein